MSEYEPTDEVFTWSITAAVVVIIVIVTIVIVCCILKKTPEREIVTSSSNSLHQDGAEAGQNGTREASYHKYWDVTDPRSPMGANSAGRFIRRYIYGNLRSVDEIERDEEAEGGIYRGGSHP